jgi:hypothetical protein
MAAVTTTAIAGGLGLYQAINGKIEKDKTNKELANYERVDLTNAYEDQQISTMGSDYLAEQNSISSANMVNAVQGGGIRGVLGGIPSIQAQNNNNAQQGRTYLDNQVLDRNQNIAQDNVRIQNTKAGIDEQNIAGLGSRENAARQDMWSGMMGVAKAGIYGANNIGKDSSTSTEELVGGGSGKINQYYDKFGTPIKNT